jgi:hypothetical protein
MRGYNQGRVTDREAYGAIVSPGTAILIGWSIFVLLALIAIGAYVWLGRGARMAAMPAYRIYVSAAETAADWNPAAARIPLRLALAPSCIWGFFVRRRFRPPVQ